MATNLVIPELYHVHAADGSLVITPVITIAEAAHIHAADNLSLSVLSDLVLSHGRHDHVSHELNTRIPLIVNLTIQEREHSQSAESLILVRTIQLVIAGSDHAHDTDGTFVISKPLVIAESGHALVSDDAFKIVPTLSSLSGDHAQYIDNLALIVHLTIAGSDHINASDNLTIKTTLAFDSIYHVLYVEPMGKAVADGMAVAEFTALVPTITFDVIRY